MTAILNEAPVRRGSGRRPKPGGRDPIALTREWLVTNGLGGYASGTVRGVATRRYHGLLIAALPGPARPHRDAQPPRRAGALPTTATAAAGRRGAAGRRASRCASGAILPSSGSRPGCPVWRVRRVGDVVIEKRMVMPHGQNTVHVTYRCEAAAPVRLRLRPAVHFRGHDARRSDGLRPATPLMRRASASSSRTDGAAAAAAHDSAGAMRRFTLEAGGDARPASTARGERAATSAASCGARATSRRARTRAGPPRWSPPPRAGTPIGAHAAGAALAAERAARLLIDRADPPRARAAPPSWCWPPTSSSSPRRPRGRRTRARAAGRRGRTVIAGYHWFTDWGRDTMISLEGLTLSPAARARPATSCAPSRTTCATA